jgi:heme O synthase-like polyprenyltransferase
MLIRNAVILGLTLLGGGILVWGMWEDPPAARLTAAGVCFLVATVYAQVTKR